MDEKRLLERARAGDVAAYRALLEPQQSAALRAAWLVLRDWTEAEDAVQDAFIKAYGKLRSLRQPRSFRGWLLRIVTNESLNRVRAAERRRRAIERNARLAPTESDHPSAEATALESDAQRVLRGAVMRLPQDDRLVIGLRYFLDLSQEETAQVLGVPTGTIKSRQSRALERLRSQLVDAEPVEVSDA